MKRRSIREAANVRSSHVPDLSHRDAWREIFFGDDQPLGQHGSEEDENQHDSIIIIIILRIIMTDPKARSHDDKPTAQEVAWAQAIRRAARSDPTILHAPDVTDWEFLQHAIVAKDNISKALKRIRRLQKFKSRHGIVRDGNVHDARRDLQAYLQLHPGFFVAVGSIGDDSARQPCPQVFCYQYSNFRGTSMKSEESYAIFMRTCFYCLQACQHNLAALRSGIYLIGNARHMTWRNFSLGAELRTSELIVDSYPIRLYKIAVLYVSPLFRFLYTLCRSMMSAKYQRLAEFVGASATPAYLQDLPVYCLPTAWGGTFCEKDFIETILRRLKERFDNSDNFLFEKV